MAVDVQFKHYVEQLIREKKEERVHQFDYEGKRFWLKLPEHLSGVSRFLKPHPKQAFKKELQALLDLAKQQAPVPAILYYGDDFFVLEDVGHSLSQWMDREDCSHEKKLSLLCNASQALIELHQKSLVHGRPAIRDITWQDGKITFLDFESHSKSQNMQWLKVRDILLFFYSLCREESVSDELIQQTAVYYQKHCDKQDWQAMLAYLQRFKWLYFVLLGVKPFAKKDLIGVYRLFELLLLKEKQ